MRKNRPSLVAAASLVLLAVLPAPARGAQAWAAAQGVELWGGPGAKGAGAAGARFDTTITVSAVSPASGTIDFYVNGSVTGTTQFALPARGVFTMLAPTQTDG